MALLTYSPEDVIVLIANVIPISGMADGTFIEISKDDKAFTARTSSDGVVSRSYRDSSVYTLNLTLHSASTGNEILSKLMIADFTTRSASFPLFIKDSSGGFIFQSMDSWIVSAPTVQFSDEITERTWEICCTNVAINIGGNGSDQNLLRDLGNIALGVLPNLPSLGSLI